VNELLAGDVVFNQSASLCPGAGCLALVLFIMIGWLAVPAYCRKLLLHSNLLSYVPYHALCSFEAVESAERIDKETNCPRESETCGCGEALDHRQTDANQKHAVIVIVIVIVIAIVPFGPSNKCTYDIHCSLWGCIIPLEALKRPRHRALIDFLASEGVRVQASRGFAHPVRIVGIVIDLAMMTACT
jgi:hypothetical protein